jgi:DNA invertase Pin-like site-specific DNA recombinase
MTTFAYCYSDPQLDPPPDLSLWQDVDRVYQDLGQRSQWQQLLIDCQTTPPDYLSLRRLEELGDSIAEISDRLAQLQALGVKVKIGELSVAAELTLRTDLLQLLREIGQHQRSRRLCQGHARNRLKALPPPGKAPYGYRRGKEKYAIDRTTAPVVKDFFENFLLFGSLRGAVRHLAQKYGKKISVTTGRRWLTNPVYRGDTAYHNGETIANTHVPIISREEAAQIDRLLRRNRQLPPRTASAPRSLAGLVVCSECQAPLTIASVTARRQKREYLYLRSVECPQRPKCRAIAYEQVLEQTIAAICRDLPGAVAQMNFPQLDVAKNSLLDAIADKEEILAQLPQLTNTGVLDEQTASLRTYKLRTEISQLQAKFATFPPVNLRSVAQAVSIPQFWLDLSEAERRFYFREFISQIQILRQDEAWQIQLVFVFYHTENFSLRQ